MLINVKMYFGDRCPLKNFKMANRPQFLSFKHIEITSNNTQDIDKRYKSLCYSVKKNEWTLMNRHRKLLSYQSFCSWDITFEKPKSFPFQPSHVSHNTACLQDWSLMSFFLAFLSFQKTSDLKCTMYTMEWNLGVELSLIRIQNAWQSESNPERMFWKSKPKSMRNDPACSVNQHDAKYHPHLDYLYFVI